MAKSRRTRRVGSVLGIIVVGVTVLAACSSAHRSQPPVTSAPPNPSLTATSDALPPRATVNVVVPPGNNAAPFDVPRPLTVPAGATVTAWARIPGARFGVWTPQGDLLVSSPSTGSVRRIHPEASGNPTITTVVSGLSNPHGMAFDTLAGTTYLYVIEPGQLDRYEWTGTGVGARVVLISGLPGGDVTGYAHPLKAVVVGPDHRIYLDVASSSNADPADRSAGEALIAAYQPDGSGREVLMVGVRNGEALAFAPDGQLWTAVNQRDRITYPSHGPFGGMADAYGQFFTDYGNDHPADQIAKVIPGRDLGWPYCFADQDLSTSKDPFGSMQFRADPETNPNGTALNCGSLQPLERGIQAHSAPLGLAFLGTSTVPAPWRGGAVVATHGSNNHVPPLAGSVLWMPFQNGTLGPAQDLLTGFEAAGQRWGRPVEAVPGPDGALYVMDDAADVVYRVTLGT